MSGPKKPSAEAAFQDLLATLDTGALRELLLALYNLTDTNKIFIANWAKKKRAKQVGKAVELVNVHDLISLPQVAPEYGYHPD